MSALHATTDTDTDTDTDTAESPASSPAFREAFALLSKHGLTYDCWVYDNNLEALTDLAKSFPSTTIIVDHCGGPVGVGETQEATLARWEPRIRALAKQPNVVCKLSGLGMLPVGLGLDDAWTEPASSETLAKLWQPYLTVCIDAFGVDRCMFASNFPVDKVGFVGSSVRRFVGSSVSLVCFGRQHFSGLASVGLVGLGWRVLLLAPQRNPATALRLGPRP